MPTPRFENIGGESDMSSADKDNIIDAIYGHSELTMNCAHCVCVCVCVCLCLHACVCDDSTSVTACLNVCV